MIQKHKMERTRVFLMAEMCTCILISIVMVVLFETETLLPGYCQGDTGAAFIILSMMEVLTICAIPLSLRLFKFKKVRASITGPESHRGLLAWGSFRMMLVCVPMMANTLFYYMFDLKPAFGYMGIISLICLVFISPSKSRCLQETGQEE